MNPTGNMRASRAHEWLPPAYLRLRVVAKEGATTRKVAFDAFGRRVALGHLVAQALELIYAASVSDSTNHGRQIPGLSGSSDSE